MWSIVSQFITSKYDGWVGAYRAGAAIGIEYSVMMVLTAILKAGKVAY